MAYSYDEVYTYIKENKGELLTSREDYKNTKEKMLIKCWHCGKTFKQSFQSFRNSKHKACKKCAYYLLARERSKTTEEFKREVYSLEGDNYEVLGEYFNAKTKIKMKHKECGYEYYVTPRAFLEQGNRCVKCGEYKKMPHEVFLEKVYNLVGDEYTVLEEYKTSMDKINIKHNKCRNVWFTTPNNFLAGTRCPYCQRSTGEEKIAKVLENNKIKYNEQQTFDNCKYINPLFFDFYLPEHNLCIEFDGRHHFELCGFGEKDKNKIIKKFNNIKKRDQIKNKYCKDNDIKLLRIPYWDFDNIENIINEQILKEIS